LQDELRRWAIVVSGLAELVRNRAEEVVGEFIHEGESGRDNASSMVRDAVNRTRDDRADLVRAIRSEMQNQMVSLGAATARDVERVERGLERLADRVTGLEQGGGNTSPRSGARKKAARKKSVAATTTAAPGGRKKSTVKRSTRKKSTAKRSSAGKKSTATGSRARKSAAKRSTAKKSTAKKPSARRSGSGRSGSGRSGSGRKATRGRSGGS